VQSGANGTFGEYKQSGGMEGIGDAEKIIETKQAEELNPNQTGGSSRAYNIYQVMNLNDSKTPLNFAPENPFKPYALPCAIAVFVVGGIFVLLRYRQQSRKVLLKENV
jgi:hypothetical protein